MDEENQNLNTGVDGTQVDNNQTNFNEPVQEAQPSYNGPIQEAQPTYGQPIQNQPVNTQYSQPNNMQYNGQYVPPQPNNQYNPNVGPQLNNQYNQYNPNMNGQYNNQYNPNMNGQYNNQYNPNMNGQYNNQYNQPNQNISNDQGEKAPLILRIVCFLLPIVGLILYCVNSSSNKTYAHSCGKAALAGFITGIIIYALLFLGWILIWFGVGMAVS